MEFGSYKLVTIKNIPKLTLLVILDIVINNSFNVNGYRGGDSITSREKLSFKRKGEIALNRLYALASPRLLADFLWRVKKPLCVSPMMLT